MLKPSDCWVLFSDPDKCVSLDILRKTEVTAMDGYKPPFHTTDRMTSLVGEISEQVGRIIVLQGGTIKAHLRRENRIRTIHSSLAIENNTLSIEQVTAIIDGKRILGNPNEIREVQNAYEAYELMLTLDPSSVDDLLRAHSLMMKGLVPENGKFRSGSVGVFDGKVLIHMAPPAASVPFLIKDLFKWYRQSQLHPLIKSAVFHYEFEFIHPFSGGNGRMGRMWHSLLLGAWKELFFWLPVEELIQARQKDYYNALNESGRLSDCAVFVELMLEIIRDSLKNITVVGSQIDSQTDQVKARTDQVEVQTDQVKDISDQVKARADQIVEETVDVSDSDTEEFSSCVVYDGTPAERVLAAIGNDTLSASDLMRRLGLSHKPTFRRNYLNPALSENLIERTIPDKPNSRNQKYRKHR